MTTPVALTAMEKVPRAAAAEIAALTASSSLLSPAMLVTRPPGSVTRSAACSAAGSRTTTPTPRAASRRTVARPSPPAPPATTADGPSSCIRQLRSAAVDVAGVDRDHGSGHVARVVGHQPRDGVGHVLRVDRLDRECVEQRTRQLRDML